MFHSCFLLSEGAGQVFVPTTLCIAIMIIIAVLIFSLVVTWSRLIFYKSKLESAQSHQVQFAADCIQKEGERMAKNIHDSVSALLNVAKQNLSRLSRNYNDQVLSEKLIKESMDTLDESIDAIRNIAKELSPPSLCRLGYEKGVAELCRKISTSERIVVNLILSEKEVRLSSSKEFQLYRMTQELLNNIVKHSGVKEIDISIKSNEKGVSTVISYYGFGITTEMADELSESDRGTGLKSIQNRANLINAKVNYILIGANECKTTIDVPAFENYDKTRCN